MEMFFVNMQQLLHSYSDICFLCMHQHISNHTTHIPPVIAPSIFLILVTKPDLKQKLANQK